MTPISFPGPMMRAILAGAKTETRRLVRWPILSESDGAKRRLFVPSEVAEVNQLLTEIGRWHHPCRRIACPYGQPGDVLRIKEDLRVNGAGTTAVYAADGLPVMVNGESLPWRWKRSHLPARFMPTIACRYRPPLLDVRVERLQAITEEGAIAEGIPYLYGYDVASRGVPADGRRRFAEEWDTINGKRAPWSSNPWVWVIRFEAAP